MKTYTEKPINGIFQYKLGCEWEVAMSSLFNLSSRNSMDGLIIDYIFVKDYCKEYSLNGIDIFALMRRIASALSIKKQK